MDNYRSGFKASHAKFKRLVKSALNYILRPQFTTYTSLKFKVKKLYDNDTRMPTNTLGINLLVIFLEFWLHNLILIYTKRDPLMRKTIYAGFKRVAWDDISSRWVLDKEFPESTRAFQIL
jgi:hypothetical protein